ncbi:MAG: Gfo/Idh/MocA family protein [Candidatus Glassbacteria bacterium]
MPIRIGLVGVGAIAQVAHLPAYDKIQGIEVTALCDRDEEKTSVVAGRYGIRKVYTRYEDLLGDPEIDAVDVCIPNYLHYDVVTQAVERGKDVICEKPLSLNSNEAKRIVNLVEKHNRKLLVAFNNRFRLDTSIIKARIEQGELGKIMYLKTGWLKKKFSLFRQPWAFSRMEAGGGAFIDMGIHLIDVCLWLLGYPEVKRVSAFLHNGREEGSVEDGGIALIVTEGDVSIFVEVFWGLHLKEGFHYLNVYGENGSAQLDPFCIYGGANGEIVDKTPKITKSRENIFIESYRHEIEYFVEVLGGRADPPRLEEQIILHEAIDAIYRSARDGTEIALR